MKKSEFVKAVVADTGITPTQARAAFDSLVALSVAALKKGQRVVLGDLGTIHLVSERSSSVRVSTGRRQRKAKIPKFRAGKALKDFVN